MYIVSNNILTLCTIKQWAVSLQLALISFNIYAVCVLLICCCKISRQHKDLNIKYVINIFLCMSTIVYSWITSHRWSLLARSRIRLQLFNYQHFRKKEALQIVCELSLLLTFHVSWATVSQFRNLTNTAHFSINCMNHIENSTPCIVDWCSFP